MITTDHQLRVSTSRLESFRAALEKLAARHEDKDPFHVGNVRAVQSQIDELKTQIDEYKALKSGAFGANETSGLADLPKALIRARIARGMSQSELAEVLRLKPQQVQRWEANSYSSVGFDTLIEIANALKLTVRQTVSLDGGKPVSRYELKRALDEFGLPKEVTGRFFMVAGKSKGDSLLVGDVDERAQVLLGLGVAALAAGQMPERAHLRFKLPTKINEKRTSAYAAYINGLCTIAAKTLRGESAAIPSKWRELRSLLFDDQKPTLARAIQRCWDLNIAVLALDDPVALHGACWRQNGRAVIILKQPIKSESRWLFDLVHELFHLAVAPAGDFALLESDDESIDRQSQEEKRANRFAALLLTDGGLVEITDKVFALADNDLRRLKSATIAMAEQVDLDQGLLANLVAQRVAEDPSNQSWWPTAMKLQQGNQWPWLITRDLFLENARVGYLGRVEQDLILELMELPDA